MEKWKEITDQVVIPIIETEKQLEENQKTGVIINQPE